MAETKNLIKSKKNAVQMPSKKTMNFVHHQSSFSLKKVLPIILVIVIVGAIFAKLGFIDPLAKKTAAYNELTLKQEQLAAIRRLEASGAYAELPDKIRKTAELRKQHPEATLSELAQMQDPPLTKSAINHRMRKLLELSKQ